MKKFAACFAVAAALAAAAAALPAWTAEAVADEYTVEGGRLTYTFDDTAQLNDFDLYSQFGRDIYVSEGKAWSFVFGEQKMLLKEKQFGELDARVYYDRGKDRVIFDRSRMGTEITHDAEEKDASVRSVKVSTGHNRLSMRIFLDVSSCEVFLNGGERTMTGNVYSDGEGISFFAEGGTAKLLSLDKYDIVV